MAGVVHISEEEAARDFGALMKHVRSGDEVLLDCEDGIRAVVKKTELAAPELAAPNAARSISEIIAGLEQRKKNQGLAILDDRFEADVAEARARYNAPRDHSAWD